MLGEVFLEEGDPVAHLHHGRPRRRRVLRALEPEVDQLGHDIVPEPLVRHRRRRVRQPRLPDDLADVVRVVPLHPIVQREPLLEDHIGRPLPGDQLEKHHAEAVHVALRRWVASQSVL